MSETPLPPSAPDASEDEDDAMTPVAVTVNHQYVKDLSFECPSAAQAFEALARGSARGAMTPLSVNVQSRPLAANVHEVTLNLRFESRFGDVVGYIVELAYVGVFTLPNLPEEAVKMFALVEAPRLLFPFARALVARLVQESGFPPVMLNPLDFGSLYASSDATTH